MQNTGVRNVAEKHTVLKLKLTVFYRILNKGDKHMMTSIEQLKNNPDLINEIDWEMTPEEAVRLYLEWGNNWVHGKYVIRSKSDVSYYFVVYAWEEPPVIYLIRRNSEDAQELARIEMPDWLSRRFRQATDHHKGVYSIEGEVRQWLENQLSGV